MDVSDLDPAEPKIQLAILQERQRNSEERIRQLEQELALAYTNSSRKDKELEQLKDEREGLRTGAAVLKKELQHTHELLLLNNQTKVKKRTTAKT